MLLRFFKTLVKVCALIVGRTILVFVGALALLLALYLLYMVPVIFEIVTETTVCTTCHPGP